MSEYRVLTECNRNFIWSAPDLDWLMRELVRKGYRATLVMENAEYEREQDTLQKEWNWKAEREIEGEKTA
ncbi:hypothetical protein DVH26_07650 [Paenibacillus sp. H1-7]|uniref:hypothetical protein n=1 Tax=Paenibacillus sp. H1-7 TaxID=2282849 RepID=UPI001EF9ABBD|nr:hypothetical protein [Paenibacillus sp. H1-7]ULL14332.1 hypothetical protein DVH26_07650 [Paenibacillus sp. H1-7]